MVHKCFECANSIFDETWGEYKCKVTRMAVLKPIRHDGCKEYKAKNKGCK